MKDVNFQYEGQYRVQSRGSTRASFLSGTWISPESAADLDRDIINQWLRLDPRYLGRMRVSMRPARVAAASGDFLDEPDILYKKANFDPLRETPAMPVNIVDVIKAVSKWKRRQRVVEALVGIEQYAAIESFFDSLERVVANEYFVHEAGHALGYDVETKSEDGYFRVEGRVIWPLVFVEELRADLLGFGLAVQHLAPREAAAIFLYNCLLRLGVHLEAMQSDQRYPYGAVPFMLYFVLRDADWLRPGSRAIPLRIGSLNVSDLISVMTFASRHAVDNLLDQELRSPSRNDAAIVAASYYRERFSEQILQELNQIFASAS